MTFKLIKGILLIVASVSCIMGSSMAKNEREDLTKRLKQKSGTKAYVLKGEDTPKKDPLNLKALKTTINSAQKDGIPDVFFSIPDRENALYPILTKGEPTELQMYDLSELSLKATIKAQNSVAIVVARDGRSFIIRVGDFAGQYGGKVVNIDRGKIVVKEKYLTYSKSIKTITKELVLSGNYY